ncbi:phospholipid/cholesterol/gamma-HCH transport system permease protein [Azospirillaceae bacterium]
MDSAVQFLGFAIDVVMESLRFANSLVQGKTRFGARAFRQEFIVLAIQPLPVVSIFAVSLGLILASQGARLLRSFNLTSTIIEAIMLALARDFAPIVVGIFVAGRGGVALAVRMGLMVLTREIDALTLMDISRLRFLVAPTFCVTILSTAALTLWCCVLSMFAAGAFLEYDHQVPLTMFIGMTEQFLSVSDFVTSLLKSVTIGMLVVIISSYNGLMIDSHAGGLSRVATQTIVQALLIVILVQLMFSLARV